MKNNGNPGYRMLEGRDRTNNDNDGVRASAASTLSARAHWRDIAHIPKGEGKSGKEIQSRASLPSKEAKPDETTRDPDDGMQTSTKFGVVSGAEKQESSRHFIEPTPQSTPVAGAFGKTGSLSETEEEMIHPKEDSESDRKDFIAERRRQDRRAKK